MPNRYPLRKKRKDAPADGEKRKKTMPRTVSIGAKIKQLSGLVDTKDVSEKDNRFIKSIAQQTDGGRNTAGLSDKQLDWLDDLWAKHFA